MTPDIRWTNSDSTNTTISITVLRTTSETAEYRLAIDSGPSTIQTTAPDTELCTETQSGDKSGKDTYRVQVMATDRTPHVTLETPDQPVRVVLPRPTVLTAARGVVEGDSGAVEALVDAVTDPAALPFCCGRFLSVDQLLTVLDRVTAQDRYTAGRLHTTRYATVRGGLLGAGGFTLETADVFKTFVDGLDALDGIGAVDPVEALGDFVATVPIAPLELQPFLEARDFDWEALLARRDGLFLAAALAHRVRETDVERAYGLAVNCRWRADQNYKRGKKNAEAAERGERGRAWRRLLCAAARHSPSEFRYTLMNALHWTATDLYTDGRLSQLLFQAARTIAEQLDVDFVETRGEIKRHFAEGHRLRSHGYYALAQREFTCAVDAVQSADDALPSLEATARQYQAYAAAVRYLSAGEYKAALTALDAGISEVIEIAPSPECATSLVQLLAGKKWEIEGLQARSIGRYQTAIEHFEDAIAMFETRGLDRSRDRVESSLMSLRERVSDEAQTETSVEPEVDDQPPAASTTASSSSEPASDPSSKPVHQQVQAEPHSPPQGSLEQVAMGEDDTSLAVDRESPETRGLFINFKDGPAGVHRHGESRRLDESDSLSDSEDYFL